jgi:hypothetical protein
MKAAFSLTLTLSRWERGQLALMQNNSRDYSINPAFGFAKKLETILPLPAGEGRGEGERSTPFQLS